MENLFEEAKGIESPKLTRAYIPLIRWLALIPALIGTAFIAHLVFEGVFTVIQQHLGISDEDLYGMSIMDQMHAFGIYGCGIVAFFSVLTCYVVAPRAKLIVSLVVLVLQLPLQFGSGFAGLIIGGLSGLILSIILCQAYDWLRSSKASAVI